MVSQVIGHLRSVHFLICMYIRNWIIVNPILIKKGERKNTCVDYSSYAITVNFVETIKNKFWVNTFYSLSSHFNLFYFMCVVLFHVDTHVCDVCVSVWMPVYFQKKKKTINLTIIDHGHSFAQYYTQRDGY